MTEKHTYIKELYRKWNTLGLEEELNKIENIINDYRIQLKNTIIPHEKEKFEEIIKENSKLARFIQKLKYTLYEKLK